MSLVHLQRQDRTKEKLIKVRSVIADKIAMKVRTNKYVPGYLYEAFLIPGKKGKLLDPS